MKTALKVSVRGSDDGRFGDNITVRVNGVTVAHIQGASLDDVSVRAIKRWAHSAYEGQSTNTIRESAEFGINRLRADEFRRGA